MKSKKAIFQPFLVIFTLIILIALTVFISIKTDNINTHETKVGASSVELLRTYEEAEILDDYIERSLMLASEEALRHVASLGGYAQVDDCPQHIDSNLAWFGSKLDVCGDIDLESSLITETHNLLTNKYLPNFKLVYITESFKAIESINISTVETDSNHFTFNVSDLIFPLKNGGTYIKPGREIKIPKPDLTNFNKLFAELQTCTDNDQCKTKLEAAFPNGAFLIKDDYIHAHIQYEQESIFKSSTNNKYPIDIRFLINVENNVPDLKAENIGTKTYILKTIV